MLSDKNPGFCPVCHPQHPRDLAFGIRRGYLCRRHQEAQTRMWDLERKIGNFLQVANNLNPDSDQLQQIMRQLRTNPDPAMDPLSLIDRFAARGARDFLPKQSRKVLDEQMETSHARASVPSTGDSAAAWQEKADSFLQSGRQVEALVEYEKALSLEPRRVPALRGKALVLREIGSLCEALETIDQALAIDPGFAAAWRTRGALLRDLERHDEGLACYDKGLEIEPTDAVLWLNKGNVLVKLGRTAEAGECYDRAFGLVLRKVERQTTYVEVAQGLVGRLLGKPSRAVDTDKLIVILGDMAALRSWLQFRGFHMAEEMKRSTTEEDYGDVYHGRVLWSAAYRLGTWYNRDNGEVVLSLEKPTGREHSEQQLAEWIRLAALLEAVGAGSRPHLR